MKVFILFILLFTSSCSHYFNADVTRGPSSVKSETVAEELLTIHSSQRLVSENLQESFEKSFVVNFRPMMEERTDLPKDVAFKIEAAIVDGKTTLKIFHAPKAFYDEVAVLEMANLFNSFFNGTIGHGKEAHEFFYNVRAGYPISLDNLAKLRSLNQNLKPWNVTQEAQADFEERLENAKSLRSQFVEPIKELKEKRARYKAQRKAVIATHDQLPDELQLRTLIANNDREGAADLIEKYLPWEEMAPFESRFWSTYLEVIRRPVPIEQRVLIYRGLEDDYLHAAMENGVAADKTTVLKEGKTFVMSTLIVKNQGSWNRRLRSLESMNEKFIGTLHKSSEFAQSARISTIFSNHAGNPIGSPFLSFSPDLSVAQRFGKKKRAMFLIDPRLLQYNFKNTLGENEFLVPLMTFPDEIVALWTLEFNSDESAISLFEKKLAEKMEEKYGKSKAPSIIQQIKKNSHDFYKEVFPVFNEADNGLSGKAKKFYNTLGSQPKPGFSPEGNLQCKDLIRLFW